jgi:thioredoxin 1
MKTPARFLIIAALGVAVAGAVVLRKSKEHPAAAPASASSPETANDAPSVPAKLPRLLDLGAGKCVPCKLMAPILEELKAECAGEMTVEFIDVWQHPDAGREYGIEVIPTQIFYDAGGKELFRHVGFLAKEDILAKWKELGVELARE